MPANIGPKPKLSIIVPHRKPETAALTDAATCKKYGYTPETILCIFIPNTYDAYWNIPVDKFIGKMAEESGKFWNYERKEKAKAAAKAAEEKSEGGK